MEKIKNLYNKFINTWLGKLIVKYNVIYLIMPILFYLLKAKMYKFSRAFGNGPYEIHMAIDGHIPFIKYFFVFYFVYYFLPQVSLWLVSFKDKKKYWKLFISFIIACVFANICFLIHNVIMIREPGYPDGTKFTDIRGISSFFDYCINWIYTKDLYAQNCFPSIHAIAGVLMVFSGITIPYFKDKKVPLALTIVTSICGVGCILSTVFIKQHYFIDAVAGVIVEIVIYLAVCFGYEFYKKRKANKQTEKEVIQESEETETSEQETQQ